MGGVLWHYGGYSEINLLYINSLLGKLVDFSVVLCKNREKLRVVNVASAKEEYKVDFELSKNLFDKIKALYLKIYLMSDNQFNLAYNLEEFL